jgi:CIC family chloride channel protein
MAWGGSGTDMLLAAEQAGAWRHILVLLGAGAVTGGGQIILKRLSSGNGIDTTAAIWFHAGRMPAWRTLGSAALSVVIVGMGASLGREGAPKQAGAVIANFFSDRVRLSDEQRRLLVACAAGAGMSAAYGVRLGGALFALEVMRGVLALRYVLPALIASVIATAVSWAALPDAPTYSIPAYSSSTSSVVWVLLAGPIAGLISVGYVRAVTWADRTKPQGWRRLAAPVLGLGLLGVVSIWFTQLLGNGRDISQLAFTNQVAPALLLILFVLKPAATVLCIRSGPRWLVHAFPNRGRTAQRTTGTCVVVVLARRASRAVRPSRCGSGSCGHHARPDLDGSADDGTDWPGPIIYRAPGARCRYRYAGGADHRTSLDL